MKIEVVGPGCSRCETLLENTKAAVARLGLAAEVAKVTDIAEITARGVLMTPALIVDGEVKSIGKVLTADQIFALLT